MQIGDAPDAKAFLEEIEGDAEVSPHVYISAENIGDGRIGGVRQSRTGQNELWVSYMVPTLTVSDFLLICINSGWTIC